MAKFGLFNFFGPGNPENNSSFPNEKERERENKRGKIG